MKKLFILLMALMLLLICGCSKEGDNTHALEDLDTSYYRKIVMLPNGRLLCSLEVNVDKVANAGSVFKVEKKNGKIKRITALYDGEKRGWGTDGEILYIGDILSVIAPHKFIDHGGLISFRELEITEDGDDLIYKNVDYDKEILHFKGGSNGRPLGEDKGEWQFKYDNQGRCVSRTNKSERVEYGYEGDSPLPVSLIAFNKDGKKMTWDVTMKWDEYNRLVCVMLKHNYKARFVSQDYVSVISPEPEAIMAEQVRFFYAENNPNPFSVRGYSFSGAPVVSTETGVHEYAYRYDDKGNMISVESLGIHGQPVMAIKFDSDTSHGDSCCAAVRYAYDERGRKVATATYGTDGRPVNSYKGYAEVDTPFWKDEQRDTIYFGALGQPVDCLLINNEKIKVPAYHRVLSITTDNGNKEERHFYNKSSQWVGAIKGKYTNSSLSKNDEFEKRAQEPAKAIILDTMGLTKFTHEDKPINEQDKAITAATVSTTNASQGLQSAMQELAAFGFGGVIATSYGHSSKGFLSRMNDGSVVLVDKVNNRVIKISPASAIEQIASYQGNSKRTIRLELTIYNDSRDNDAVNGAWLGNKHILPVTVEYNYENGQHIPYMIKSGTGASPGNYDNYLYETKNVEAVNMIVEEAAAIK